MGRLRAWIAIPPWWSSRLTRGLPRPRRGGQPAHRGGTVPGLLDAGLYSNTVVHRVAPGMTVQMGCPRGNGTGRHGAPAPWEPSALSLTRGRVAMEPEGDGLASSRFLVALDDLTGNGFPGAFATVLEHGGLGPGTARRSGAPRLPAPLRRGRLPGALVEVTPARSLPRRLLPEPPNRRIERLRLLDRDECSRHGSLNIRLNEASRVGGDLHWLPLCGRSKAARTGPGSRGPGLSRTGPYGRATSANGPPGGICRARLRSPVDSQPVARRVTHLARSDRSSPGHQRSMTSSMGSWAGPPSGGSKLGLSGTVWDRWRRFLDMGRTLPWSGASSLDGSGRRCPVERDGVRDGLARFRPSGVPCGPERRETTRIVTKDRLGRASLAPGRPVASGCRYSREAGQDARCRTHRMDSGSSVAARPPS